MDKYTGAEKVRRARRLISAAKGYAETFRDGQRSMAEIIRIGSHRFKVEVVRMEPGERL